MLYGGDQSILVAPIAMLPFQIPQTCSPLQVPSCAPAARHPGRPAPPCAASRFGCKTIHAIHAVCQLMQHDFYVQGWTSDKPLLLQGNPQDSIMSADANGCMWEAALLTTCWHLHQAVQHNLLIIDCCSPCLQRHGLLHADLHTLAAAGSNACSGAPDSCRLAGSCCAGCMRCCGRFRCRLCAQHNARSCCCVPCQGCAPPAACWHPGRWPVGRCRLRGRARAATGAAIALRQALAQHLRPLQQPGSAGGLAHKLVCSAALWQGLL